MSKFTHLHVHTEYSFLDGLAKIPELIDKAYQDGMRGMAITDHGNMFGVLDFVNKVNKYNSNLKKENKELFKAIIGCEVYVAAKSRHSKTQKEDRSGRHLILLAKNKEGYHNLCRLVTLAYVEGMYYTPRVDKEILKEYSEGIIACSACLGGEVPQAIMRNNQFSNVKNISVEELDLEEASKIIEEFKSIFGDDYYLELQRNGHKEQEMVNSALIYLAQKHKVKYIATNDSHFVNKEDADAHRMLVCINTRKDFNSSEGAVQDEDTDNGLAYSGEEYFKSTAEMEALFADFPEAISNTQEIFDKVEVISLASEPALPNFAIPENFSSESEYLAHLVWEGAKERYPDMSNEVKERITFELEVLTGMGYPGYFLIVWDFMNEGKKMGIRFGPGRGSAAGSALAYCLGITNIDPIKYNLLFERFLNPDRISLPDIDIDIDDSGRDKVIQYVIEKYGADRVAQIVTFNTMAAKSAIRDCARVLKLPLAESDRLAKLVPEGSITLAKAFKEVPELQKALNDGEALVKNTLKFAVKLEGTIRNSGVHACGVIIGKDKLINTLPLFTAKNADTLVIQYEGSLVEDAGLLKMDFLGLKTLNIISSALYNIKLRHGIDIDIDRIPLDDLETYELLSRGDTTAIFQLESAGMRKYLQELKPERFEDIISMVSLYRPGPMDNIPNFINRKTGKEKIEYAIPVMKEYLDETYGITVYQEQVMLLSRLLANFTRGESDKLRKAMGKKQEEVMNAMEEQFYEGGMKNGYEKEKLSSIWHEWKKFASYAFNKSHATCYAFVAYQTAYLKAHYPAEFMAANLTNNLDNLDKITQLIEDTTRMGIKILSPDINESDLSFTVNKKGDIRFGLAALKGVGSSAVEALIEERNENGAFSNVFDFSKRINLRKINKRSIESMAYAGAFDCFGNTHRAQYFYLDNNGISFIEKLINFGSKSQSNLSQNQISIFDEMPEMEELAYPEIPQCAPWHPIEQLRYEKEIAGFYISGHPLDSYKLVINSFANVPLSDLNTPENFKKYISRPVNFVGIVTEAQRLISKSNKDFGKIKLEDYSGEFQWLIFGEEYTKFRHLFEVGKQLFIKATIKEQFRGRDYQGETRYNISPIDIFYLHDACSKLCKEAILSLNIADISGNLGHLLEEAIAKSIGKIPLTIRIISKENDFNSEFGNFNLKVDPEEFAKNLSLMIPYRFELK